MVEGAARATAPAGGRFVVPELPAGLALRPTALARLAACGVRVGVITAPAGYGKTSHAAAFVSQDGRPSAWIDVEEAQNDPQVLLRDLVAALATVTDFDGGSLGSLGATPDQFATTVARDLARAVRRCTAPFVLVLDDLHRLTDQSALDLVGALVSSVPPGGLLLLVGRSCPVPELAYVRADGWVVELGIEDLALAADGVAAVLGDMGVAVDAEQVAQVVADTEGWPVGVRLAGLALRAHRPHDLEGPTLLAGREAMVSDYLGSEWLWGLSDDDREVLLGVSLLDWFSGPLCNAVLDRDDSGEVLHRIASDRLLVLPLDRREGAYRMHGLLRDALAAELERRDASAAQRVHERASAWFEAAGDADRAVRHAVASGDLRRAEHLVVTHTPSLHTNGHYTTVRRWIDLLPRAQVLRSPELCLCAALVTLGLGDTPASSVWLRLGERAVTAETSMETRLRLLDLRSTTSTGRVGPALEDAAVAYRGLSPGIWHTGACLAYGVWSWIVGDDVAVSVLAEGAEEAAVLGAPTMEANCTAVLAMIAHEEGDRARASLLAGRARRLLVDHGLEQAPSMAVITAAHALAAAGAGDAALARSEWQLARVQLAYLKDMSGWANVVARLALGRTSLLLGDRMGAETMVREVRDQLVRQPDAVHALRLAAELEELVRQMRRHAAVGSSSLTTAELRVLHYLPTNLSLASISARLYVSRYTVKTHCESTYRKLNVASRAEAVEAARRVGLLEAAPHETG